LGIQHFASLRKILPCSRKVSDFFNCYAVYRPHYLEEPSGCTPYRFRYAFNGSYGRPSRSMRDDVAFNVFSNSGFRSENARRYGLWLLPIIGALPLSAVDNSARAGHCLLPASDFSASPSYHTALNGLLVIKPSTRTTFLIER